MSNITWKLDVGISGGPSHTLTRSIKVEAYDKVKVDIGDTAPETSRPTVSPPKTRVWLQPVSAAIGLPSTPRA